MIVRAELLKLTSARPPRSLAIGALVLSAVGTVAIMAGTSDEAILANFLGGNTITIVRTLVGLVILTLGVRAMTTEFQSGTITSTLLAEPRRGVVLASKIVVHAAAGAALGALAGAVSTGVLLLYLRIEGIEPIVTSPLLVRAIGGMAVAGLLWALLGLGIGAIVKHQLAATVGTLAWFLLVDELVGMMVKDQARYLPAAAVRTIVNPPVGEFLTPMQGALTAGVIAAVLIAAGWIAFTRRDVV